MTDLEWLDFRLESMGKIIDSAARESFAERVAIILDGDEDPEAVQQARYQAFKDLRWWLI